MNTKLSRTDYNNLTDHPSCKKVDSKPTQHDCHRDTYVVFIDGKHWQIWGEYSYNEGLQDFSTVPVEVEPYAVIVTRYTTIWKCDRCGYIVENGTCKCAVSPSPWRPITNAELCSSDIIYSPPYMPIDETLRKSWTALLSIGIINVTMCEKDGKLGVITDTTQTLKLEKDKFYPIKDCRLHDRNLVNMHLYDKYMELIYADSRSFPNESRHETALRYIREAEENACLQPAKENTRKYSDCARD